MDSLPPGTNKLYLRYMVSGMALDDIRLSVYTPAKEKKSALEITHEWTANGVRQSHSLEIEDSWKEFEYTVSTGPRNIENEALIIACPR